MVIDKVAWILVEDGKILGTRSRGKDLYYLPGGKRDPGESDAETLAREIREELDVDITPGTLIPEGTFQAHADGHDADVEVKLTCYSAAFTGTLKASNEIAELDWLAHADRDRFSVTGRIVLDHLHTAGRLA